MKRLVLLLVIGLAMSGCVLQSQSSARPIDKSDVPFKLLETTTSSRPTSSTTSPAGPVSLYFVSNERLVQVNRSIAGGPTIENALAALQSTPTSDEQAAGLRNAVPPGQLSGVTLQVDNAVAVNLGSGFVSSSGNEQSIALAQIVFTMTAVPGIAKVRFLLNGQPVDVPRGDGTLTPGPLTRDDYANLAPA